MSAWTRPTKDERYENARLADRARGDLHLSEKQALHFVAQSQTMESGTCSKSLKGHAADYGYTVKSLQRGLHGKHRKQKDGTQKLEYLGILGRGIAFVVGGYPHGGLAPGGGGLTPEYALDREVLLTYVPEVDGDDLDDPGPSGKGDTKGDTSQNRATHRATQGRTSSLSSLVLPRHRVLTAPSASETPAPHADAPTQGTAAYAINGDHAAPSAVSSMSAAQTEPPTAVTCKQVGVPASAMDEKRGLQLQAALKRTAKAKLRNHRQIPENLTGKFELLGIAHGVAVVSQDFGKWCDENPTAKRMMPFPIHEYVKVVDSRFDTPVDPNIAGWVEELSARSYTLTNTLTPEKQKRQITDALKAFPIATLKMALAYYVDHLPGDLTSSSLSSFWKVSNIEAVLKAEHKMWEATEGDEDVREAKPMQHDLQAIKRQVGTLPFSQRLVLDHQGFSSCPFHNGESDTSFHVERKEDGVGIGTCFSDCAKSFDAIAFVEKFDKVSTGKSIRTLVSLVGDIEKGSASAGLPPKPKPQPMTIARWAQAGRAVTDADVATLSGSRPNSKTPSAKTFNTMGFKIGEKYGQVFLTVPYRMGDMFHTIKARNLTTKEFIQENAVSQKGLFNIDAVTEGCDVYVVESELDAAVLYESGHTAVSVMNAAQKSIEPEVLKKIVTARSIVLVGDQDAPGQICMDNLAQLLPAEKVRRLSPPGGVKDVGEWATSVHFQEQFESAIRTASQSEIPARVKS